MIKSFYQTIKYYNKTIVNHRFYDKLIFDNHVAFLKFWIIKLSFIEIIVIMYKCITLYTYNES